MCAGSGPTRDWRVGSSSSTRTYSVGCRGQPHWPRPDRAGDSVRYSRGERPTEASARPLCPEGPGELLGLEDHRLDLEHVDRAQQVVLPIDEHRIDRPPAVEPAKGRRRGSRCDSLNGPVGRRRCRRIVAGPSWALAACTPQVAAGDQYLVVMASTHRFAKSLPVWAACHSFPVPTYHHTLFIGAMNVENRLPTWPVDSGRLMYYKGLIVTDASLSSGGTAIAERRSRRCTPLRSR